MRHGCVRRLLPGDARAGRVPAGVAVRGVVPVAGAHGRARGADSGGGTRGLRAGGLAMSGLAEVVAAVDPSLTPYAVPEVPAGEWEARIGGDRAFTMEA